MGVIESIEAERVGVRAPSIARHWFGPAAIFLAVGLLLRVSAFGDPAIHIDEEWYFYVGQRMLEGAVPYVDLWDRKPLGLFVLFALFAAVSKSALSYQVAAWLFASATAFTVSRIARHVTGTQGAVLAGVVYLAALNAFAGIGGQSPVFYNLPMALGALALVSSFEKLKQGTVPPRLYAGMLACGLAITIKQTTLFESAFFGLSAVFLLYRSGNMPWPKVALMALCGALPFLFMSAIYALNGHWPEYWQAMVLSNLAKQSATPGQYAFRAIVLIKLSWPLLLFTLVAAFRKPHPFVALWFVVALIGFYSVPNLYRHYALPVMVPLAVLVAPELNRRALGLAAAVVATIYLTASGDSFDFPRHRENRVNMHRLATMIRQHSPRGTLLVFDAPPALYSLSGARPLTPLTFPNHLNHAIEHNVSHIDTDREMDRVLAERPGSVAIAPWPRVLLYDPRTRWLTMSYVRHHCRLIGSAKTYELERNDTILIYGDCN